MKLSPEIDAARPYFDDAVNRLGLDLATIEMLTVIRTEFGRRGQEVPVRALMAQTSDICQPSDAK